jgi:hypothetical protein
MENRCNGDAGKFKPAELLPTKLIVSAMLKKSYLGRESLVTLTKTATPISPKANWRFVFANGEIPKLL